MIFAELEADRRRELTEATLTHSLVSEDVLKANQSLRVAFSNLSASNQSVKPVMLTVWVTNFSIGVADQLTQVQGSTLDSETLGVQRDLQTNPSLTSTGVPPSLKTILNSSF